MLTWIALSAALGAAQVHLPEGSSDTAAALQAIDSLCPLYLKRYGLTPPEIETVRAAGRVPIGPTAAPEWQAVSSNGPFEGRTSRPCAFF